MAKNPKKPAAGSAANTPVLVVKAGDTPSPSARTVIIILVGDGKV